MALHGCCLPTKITQNTFFIRNGKLTHAHLYRSKLILSYVNYQTYLFKSFKYNITWLDVNYETKHLSVKDLYDQEKQ